MKIRMALISILTLASTAAWATEISLDEVPQVVKQAFLKAHLDAEDIQVEKEDDEYGEPLYEFEYRENGKEHEALYHTDGSFFGYEREIPVSHLPQSIREQIAKQFPNGRIDEAEVVVNDKNTPLAYEVEVKDNGEEWEVYFNADGSFINKRKD